MMKNDHYEFSTVALMAAFSMLCTLALGILIILDTVTAANSLGIEGIVEAFKTINAGLVGGMITMTRQGQTLKDTEVSITAGQAGITQEKQP